MHQDWYHIVLRQVIVVQRVEVEGVGTRVCFAEVRISCACRKANQLPHYLHASSWFSCAAVVQVDNTLFTPSCLNNLSARMIVYYT